MKRLSQENNFYYLCGALVALLFSSAAAGQFPGSWGQDLFSLAIVLMLLLSIRSLRITPTLRRVTQGMALALLLLTVVAHLRSSRFLDLLSLFLLFLFFASALRSAARLVLFVGRVDANKIVGSLSLYLLLGLLWTTLYLALLVVDPDAFHGIAFNTWREAFPRLAYYSFVTLTTLGYGDILPASRLAEFFAYMEAVTGIFYIAIVVASLVSVALREMPPPSRGRKR